MESKHYVGGEAGVGVRRTQAFLSIAIVFTLYLFVSLYPLPVRASEPIVVEILNSLGYTNVANSTVETFPPGRYNLTLYAEFTQYFNSNELSFYQVGTGNFTPILEGSEAGYGYISPLTKTFEVDFQFGLSLSRNDSLPFRYFTESSRNPGGEQQYAVVLNNLNDSGMFLIGFDDRAFCTGIGDLDYNDMVFSLQAQYYLQVVSPYDTATGGGWYYNGANATASLADGIITLGNGTRRVFTQWSGDASGTNYLKSDPILMNQNKTAVADWKSQYYLTVGTIPGGLTAIPGAGWYDANENVTLTAPSVSGYNFSYWDVDNLAQAKYLNPTTVNMDGPHTVTAHYTKTFILTITAASGGSTSPSVGTYAFDENSTVKVTATPDVNYAFDHWELDGTNVGSVNPYTVLMNSDHTLKAAFVYSPPPPQLLVSINPMSASVNKGQSVSFNSSVSGGTPPYSYQWYLDSNPVSGATSTGWTTTFTAVGVHYVYLMVTDSKGKTAQSDVARISVVSVPVGGYSVSIKEGVYTPATRLLALYRKPSRIPAALAAG
jgi:hypothetical protein